MQINHMNPLLSNIGTKRKRVIDLILELVVLFIILAIIAAILGASGVAGFSLSIAKWLIIIFIILAILAFIF